MKTLRGCFRLLLTILIVHFKWTKCWPTKLLSNPIIWIRYNLLCSSERGNFVEANEINHRLQYFLMARIFDLRLRCCRFLMEKAWAVWLQYSFECDVSVSAKAEYERVSGGKISYQEFQDLWRENMK